MNASKTKHQSKHAETFVEDESETNSISCHWNGPPKGLSKRLA